MNRELLEQCLDALESLNAMSYEVGKKLMDDIEAELAKPEPEPVAYMLTKRIFGLGGETWDTTEYRDYQWEYDCEPLYTKGTKMFDYKSESLAHSITAENAEMRESLLKQELLATQISLENLRVVTPEMIEAGRKASVKWTNSNSTEPWNISIYLAMLEAA